jgi:hypothetical protein
MVGKHPHRPSPIESFNLKRAVEACLWRSNWLNDIGEEALMNTPTDHPTGEGEKTALVP